MFNRRKSRADDAVADPSSTPDEADSQAPQGAETDPTGAEVDETGPVRTTALDEPAPIDGTVEGPAGDEEGTALPAVAYNELAERPAAEHPDKVDKPSDLKKPSVMIAVKRTLHEFGADQCTTVAAGLTYHSVMAIFPAMLALVSLLGVFNETSRSVDAVRQILGPLVSANALDRITEVVANLSQAQGAGIFLVVGIVAALFSASSYVSAFTVAMNRVYEVKEGRPVWKRKPLQVLITLITVLLCAVALVILIVSGPLAQSVGDRIGLGDTAVLVWNIAKWPVLLLVVVLVVALLYWATPNVKQPHFRWISVGAFVAIAIWVLASVGFGFYVANFSSYNKTYGSFAGVIIALLWIWLTNVAMLFGAELDSELERSRQLQSGIAAEESLQLPLRDDRGVLKAEKKEADMVGQARELREQFTHKGDVSDRPFARS